METLPKTETTSDTGHNTDIPTVTPPVLNPLAQLVSHFEDDPFWDEMQESIRLHRLEMDAAWDTVE